MASYPSLFLDSKTITEKRKIAQREKGDEDFYSSIVIRPFTIYISWPIVKYTSIKANTVTYLMALISLIAPIAIYFIEDHITFFVCAFLFYFTTLTLDVIDGEIARLRKETSELGVYVDSLLWYTVDALLTIFLLKINWFYFQIDWFVPLIILLPFIKLFSKASWVQYIVPTKKTLNITPKLNLAYYMRGIFELPAIFMYFLLIAVLDHYTSIDLLYIKYLFFFFILLIDVGVVLKKNKVIIAYLRKL